VRRTEHEDATHVHHPPSVSLLQLQLKEIRTGESEPTKWWGIIREGIVVVRERYPRTVRDDAKSRVMLVTDYSIQYEMLRVPRATRFGRVQSRDRNHNTRALIFSLGKVLCSLSVFCDTVSLCRWLGVDVVKF
jgi:hypothetical protein